MIRIQLFNCLTATSLLSTAAMAADEYTAPRTEYGHPDLQGFWTNASQTPLERPRELGDKRAFTRVSDSKIVYGFTLEDPVGCARPWTGEVAMNLRPPKSDRMYEYACHEGNYALAGILAGARQQEVQQEVQQEFAAEEAEH